MMKSFTMGHWGNRGAKKNLLKKDGLTSDVIDDSSSSSLDIGRSNKVAGSKLVQLFSRKGKGKGDGDGYESDANESTNSTRSTSSSFLRYQNRAAWKKLSKKTKKIVLQRRADGTSKPIGEESNKRWPAVTFDKIYRRQNQISKKGKEDGGSSDVSVSSIESEEQAAADESQLAPPAPSSLRYDTEEEVVVDDDEEDGIQALIPREDLQNEQLSGIPTSETPPKPSTPPHLKVWSPVEKAVAPRIDLQDETTTATAPTVIDPETSSKKKVTRSKSGATTEKTITGTLTPTSIPCTICYSLRTAIGDGSARQRNSHSLMERRVMRPNGSHVDTSYWSHRGKRSYMEDRFVIEHIMGTGKRGSALYTTLLGVFDGHGGATASQFCSDWISSYIRKDPAFPQNIADSMKSAFVKVDSDFVSSGHLDGTTACVCAIVEKQKVICCNVGDSRAILVKRDGSFVALSTDHKPDLDSETRRINRLGGRVIHWGRWRVEGVLAVSRSIGDAKLKPYVTAEPDIIEHEIDEDDMFLVVASDGVWDTMSSDLVAKFVLVNTCKIQNKSLKVDERLLRWIARQVSKRARENGSTDNVSCIIAKLH
mmetsp:Transcript_35429/g.84601  ORF Transcript_35429/g.84601 Transcript_35429/m.84601 type:complete len:594 (+) Transcript_35429:95-1876(+)